MKLIGNLTAFVNPLEPREKLIQAIWLEEGRETTGEVYWAVRGAISWPSEQYPGYLLVGAQQKESKTIRLLEEFEFKLLQELIVGLPDLSDKYLISYILIDPSDESKAFGARVQTQAWRMYESLNRRIPGFVEDETADVPLLEFNLIREAMNEKRLILPDSLEVARQMSSNWQDAEEEGQLYALKALRHLVRSFDDHRYRAPVDVPPYRPLDPRAGY